MTLKSITAHAEPSLEIERNDIDEPRLAKSRIDKEEPNSPIDITDRVDPSRLKLRKEIDDPSKAKSKSEKDEPMRT
jgi:hypothetical protein